MFSWKRYILFRGNG